MLCNTPKSKDGAVTLYDSWASTYDQTLRDWGYEAPERVARLVAEFASSAISTPGLPVFDCGCGTGMTGVALVAQAAALGSRTERNDLLGIVGVLPSAFA